MARKKNTDNAPSPAATGGPITGGRGWGIPRAGDGPGKPVAHYFRNGTSLCGTFVLFTGNLTKTADVECGACQTVLATL